MRRARRRARGALAACVLALAARAGARGRGGAGARSTPSPLAANGFESPSCTLAGARGAALGRRADQLRGLGRRGRAGAALELRGRHRTSRRGSARASTRTSTRIVQDLLVTPVWTALVWLVHVVLIALEWCYSLDLLAPGDARPRRRRRSAARSASSPIRGSGSRSPSRRSASPGRASCAAACSTRSGGGAARGDGRRRAVDHRRPGRHRRRGRAPRRPGGARDGRGERRPATRASRWRRSMARSARSSTRRSSGPWCYLEFGDVDWCRDPAALDPRLRAAADAARALYRAEATLPRPGARASCSARPAAARCRRQLAGAATALARGAHQRRAVPRAARRTRWRARRCQPDHDADALRDALRVERPDRVHRADGAAGRVPHRVRAPGRASAGCC